MVLAAITQSGREGRDITAARLTWYWTQARREALERAVLRLGTRLGSYDALVYEEALEEEQAALDALQRKLLVLR